MTTFFGVSAIIVWLVVLVLMLAVEIATMGLTTIWFAGGALIAFLMSLCHAPVIAQIIVFLIVSLILLIFTRPVAMKYFNKDRVKTNVEDIAGKQAIVVEEIDNIRGKGRATLGGQEWTARSTQEGTVISVGTIVTVKEVQGVKLIVEANKEADKAE